MTETPTVAELLAQVWIALVVETDNTAEASTRSRTPGLFRISYAMWANALRLADGSTIGGLRTSTGAEANLPGLERWGWIRLGTRERTDPDFGSGRRLSARTPVRLTRAGAIAAEAWPEAIDEVERRWERRHGAEVLATLQADAAAIGAGMPWSLPEVRASDGFLCRPVGQPQAVDGPLALVAALGAALTALTSRLESAAPMSRALSANVARALLGGPVAPRHLPAATGLAEEAVAMSLSWLRRHRLVESTPGAEVRLTPVGLERTEAARLIGDGGALLEPLEQILRDEAALREALTPPAGCWRSERPHLARTQRLLADVRAQLPHHPMPLHRGGWPDGS